MGLGRVRVEIAGYGLGLGAGGFGVVVGVGVGVEIVFSHLSMPIVEQGEICKNWFGVVAVSGFGHSGTLNPRTHTTLRL